MAHNNVLFLIFTLNIGGAEHILVDIANRMVEDGFSVTVQTLLDEGHYREKLSPKVIYRKGFHTNSRFIRKIIIKLYYLLPAGFWGRLLIKKGHSHIVAFVEGLPTKIVYGYPGREAKKIAWVHTDLYRNPNAKGHSEQKEERLVFISLLTRSCASAMMRKKDFFDRLACTELSMCSTIHWAKKKSCKKHNVNLRISFGTYRHFGSLPLVDCTR